MRELGDFLRQDLPEYMVPAVLTALERLPLTPNGKLDRKALPAPSADAARGDGAGRIAPRDTTELRMARLWEQTLGTAPIGVRDDFFALGGHSLKAFALMAAVRREFGVELPLNLVFHAAHRGAALRGAAGRGGGRRQAAGPAGRRGPVAAAAGPRPPAGRRRRLLPGPGAGPVRPPRGRPADPRPGVGGLQHRREAAGAGARNGRALSGRAPRAAARPVPAVRLVVRRDGGLRDGGPAGGGR